MIALDYTKLVVLGGGYAPALVVQGKVCIVMGPLEPSDDRPPVFAQTYLLDPTEDPNSLEVQQRLKSLGMYLKMKSKLPDWKLSLLKVFSDFFLRNYLELNILLLASISF